MNDLQKLMSLWQQVEIHEKKKLDPVGQEDGDIDNDGDTDSSDEYLKNRRKRVSSSIKSQKDEDCDCDATEEKEPKKKVSKKEGYGTKKEGKMECPKCKGEGCDHCDDKGYHMKEEFYGVEDDIVEAMGEGKAPLFNFGVYDKDGKLKGASSSEKDAKSHAFRIKGKAVKFPKPMKQTDIDKKMTLESIEDFEDIKRSLPTDRFVQRWSDFSEAYDEVNFKGKKRPQDMPIGQSSVRDVDSNKQTKGSTPPEGIMDKESEKSKQFYKDHQKSDPKWENLEDEGHDDVSKAGRGVKSQSPNRMGRDNRKGDNNVINPITQKQ